MSIFEQATQQKLRFGSARGELTTEQLWDLPLQSKNEFDLDSVAKTVYTELKSRAEESFVTTSTDPRKARLELMLEVVKHVIASKQADAAARRDQVRRSEERQRILEVIDRKRDAALADETLEQLQERLKTLS